MWIGKRFFDFFFSLIGLILLSPVFLLLAVWIKLDSKGPVFYRQIRVGRSQQNFRIHKFRSMILNADQKGLAITVGEDQRITRSGHFIRKYKLDEFAQLIDVVLGDMSLVGPRPEVPKYVGHYPEEIKKIIFSVRPGITDWASIFYKDENSILEAAKDPEKAYIEEILPKKLEYCVRYVEKASVFEDLKVLFVTVKEIFLKR